MAINDMEIKEACIHSYLLVIVSYIMPSLLGHYDSVLASIHMRFSKGAVSLGISPEHT